MGAFAEATDAGRGGDLGAVLSQGPGSANTGLKGNRDGNGTSSVSAKVPRTPSGLDGAAAKRIPSMMGANGGNGVH